MKLNKNNYPYYAIGKKRSYSSLKVMAKDELIELLKIAQHNYECVNESLYYVRKHAERLDRALDKACELIKYYSKGCPYSQFDYDRNCQESCINNPKECWRDYLMKGDKDNE